MCITSCFDTTSFPAPPPPHPSPQFLTALLFQPALLFLSVLGCFVVWPPVAPGLAWVPGVGPWLAGPAAVRAFTAGPRGVLTRRLEHVSGDRKEGTCPGAPLSTQTSPPLFPQVTLLRAAAAAAGLPPAAALTAFGMGPLKDAAISAVAALLRRQEAPRHGAEEGEEEESHADAVLLRAFVLAQLQRCERSHHE